MGKNTQTLLVNYKKSCNDIVAAFAEKQSLYFDGWIGDNVGETASFSDGSYLFTMNDIVLDFERDSPEGLIKQWYNDSYEFNVSKKDSKKQYINYVSYCMGLIYENLQNTNNENNNR